MINKKIVFILIASMITALCQQAVLAVNVGTYKSESEYGIFDGFKINWKRQDKNQKLIEVREQSTKEEAAKEYRQYKDTEYERTKYMYEGRSFL